MLIITLHKSNVKKDFCIKNKKDSHVKIEKSPINANKKNTPVSPSKILIISPKMKKPFMIRYIAKNKNKCLNNPNWNNIKLIHAIKSKAPNNFIIKNCC